MSKSANIQMQKYHLDVCRLFIFILIPTMTMTLGHRLLPSRPGKARTNSVLRHCSVI